MSLSKDLSDIARLKEGIDDAIARTDEIVYLEEFGAVGDGSTNDTTAIQNAFNSGAKYISGKSDDWYMVHGKIDMPTGVTLFGGLKFDGSNAGNEDIFQHNASTDHETTVASIVNNRTIELTNIGTIEAGDHIRLFSNVLWYYDNRTTRFKGEVSRVKEVDGSNVILYDALHDDYDLAGSETLTVHTKKPVTFRFRNIRIKGNGSSNGEMSCIRLYHTVNDVFDNVQTEEKGRGITLTGTYQSRIINPSMKGKFFAAANGTYGVVPFGSIHTKIYGGVFTGHRSPIDFSGGSGGQVSRHGHVFGCHIDGAGNESSQFDGESRGLVTHGTAEYITFESCTVRNVGRAVIARGRHHRSLNNTFINVKEDIYRLTHGADFEAIGDRYLFEGKGEYLDLTTVPTSQLAPNGFRIQEDWNFDSKLKVHNCEIYTRQRMFFWDSATWGTDPLKALDIQNNTLGMFQGNISNRAFFHSVQGAPIRDSIIANNTFLGAEPLYYNTNVDNSSQVLLQGANTYRNGWGDIPAGDNRIRVRVESGFGRFFASGEIEFTGGWLASNGAGNQYHIRFAWRGGNGSTNSLIGTNASQINTALNITAGNISFVAVSNGVMDIIIPFTNAQIINNYNLKISKLDGMSNARITTVTIEAQP